MELVKVSQAIQNVTINLKRFVSELAELSESRDTAVAEYEKLLAKTLIKLKNGCTFMIDDSEVQNPQATIMEKIARGICWAERLKADLAESKLKIQYAKIDAVKSVINAYQSINKYLSEV